MFLNNFLFIPYGLAGAFIDIFTKNKFTYPSHVFINPLDKGNKYKIFGNYSHKNELYLNVSIPEINYIYQYTQYAGYVQNGGFMGISAGIDYYHKPLQFVNLSGTIALTYPAPIPIPMEYFGPYDVAYTKHISFSNNHRFWFLSAGYGLSFSQNVWRFYNNEMGNWSMPYSIIKKNYALGFVFPVYIKLSRVFHLGFIYRPSFYRPHTFEPLKYEHLMSMELAWKFGVRK